MINTARLTYSGSIAHEYACVIFVAAADTFHNLSRLLSGIVSLLASA